MAICGKDGIPHLEYEISEDHLMEGIEKIVQILRPHWNVEEISVEPRSTGYCNKNYALLNPGTRDGLFLRLINPKIPGFVNTSINAMIYLKRQKIGAEMLLTFNNGLVMEFIYGEILTWEDADRIKEKELWLSAAREMAKYHHSTNYDDIKELGIGKMKDAVDGYDRHFRSGSENTVKEFVDLGFPSLDEIQRLRYEMYEIISEAGAELRFCHVDSNPTNFILTDKGVVYVDYDYCMLDYCCIEIAGLFSCCGNIMKPGFEKQFPKESEEEDFVREYLRARAELEPSRGPVTEKSVRFWQFLIRKAKLLSYLTFMLGFIMIQECAAREMTLKSVLIYWELYKTYKKNVHEKFEHEDD